MCLQNTLKLTALLAALATAFTSLQADTVVVKDGSRLVGTVTQISAGHVLLDTAYAGTLKIKQAEIVSLDTTAPMVVRLSGGTTMAGRLSTTSDGEVSIKGDDGTITTKVEKIAVTWEPGSTDPAVAALQPKWSYQATVDITGKTGNSEELGTSFGFRAKRKTSKEILELYTNYERQKTNGTKSSDRFVAGIDYSHMFSEHTSWYLRDEGGFDRVKDIDYYNVAAAGLGYNFIQRPVQKLTGRFGLSHRFENYGNPASDDVNSAGLDLALIHDYTFENAKMHNEIGVVPAFNDFDNYQAKHDSYFEMPIGAGYWKLRIGVRNDYISMPGPGVERLDTTYYTRLILNWE